MSAVEHDDVLRWFPADDDHASLVSVVVPGGVRHLTAARRRCEPRVARQGCGVSAAQGLHARYLVDDFGTGAKFIIAVGEAGDDVSHHPIVAMGNG